MQNDKLLPCPFCGIKLHKHYRYYHHEINGCIFDNYEFFAEDFDKWNTRNPMKQIRKQLLERMEDLAGYTDDDIFLGEYNGYKGALEIVRKGGVDNAG